MDNYKAAQRKYDNMEAPEYYDIPNPAEESATGIYIKIEDVELNINYTHDISDARKLIYTGAEQWTGYEWREIALIDVIEYIDFDYDAIKAVGNMVVNFKDLF